MAMPEHSHGCEEPVGGRAILVESKIDLHAAGDCPHINRNDSRCSHRFSLGRIDQAFSVCFGAYHGCPNYHRINGELYDRVQCTGYRASTAVNSSAAGSVAAAAITISAPGSERLRATGT
jgi:hypothetical protein